MIKITQTEISSCTQRSRDLLDDARRYLVNASESYSGVSRELSRLDVAKTSLMTFVDNLESENVNLRPLVDRAIEHARQLQIQADELDRCPLTRRSLID